MKPKSHFLQRVDWDSDDGTAFRRGIKEWCELDGETLVALARSIPVAARIRTERQMDAFVQAQVEEYGISCQQAGRAVDHAMLPLVRSLAGQHGEAGRLDSADALLSDLADELHVVDAENREKVLGVLQVLVGEVVPLYEEIDRRRSHISGVLPSWTGIGTTVEVRGVLAEDYHLGDSVVDYRPRFVDAIPIASVVLKVDRGEPERFAFQVDEEKLASLIAALCATQLDLRELAQRLTFRAEDTSSDD